MRTSALESGHDESKGDSSTRTDNEAGKLRTLIKELITEYGYGNCQRYKESGIAITRQCLTLLNELLKARKVDELCELLKLHPGEINCWTFGHCIAHHYEEGTVQQYLTLLSELLKEGKGNELRELLKFQDMYGYTIGHLLADHTKENTEVTIQQYLTLLSGLFRVGGKEDELCNLLKLQAYGRYTFGDLLVDQNPKIVYQLINSGLLPNEELKKFKDKKQAVFDHVKTLPLAEKKAALDNALHNKGTLLSQFFWLPRGIRQPNPKRKWTILNAVSKEFNNLKELEEKPKSTNRPR